MLLSLWNMLHSAFRMSNSQVELTGWLWVQRINRDQVSIRVHFYFIIIILTYRIPYPFLYFLLKWLILPSVYLNVDFPLKVNYQMTLFSQTHTHTHILKSLRAIYYIAGVIYSRIEAMSSYIMRIEKLWTLMGVE